jgi:hypothetical protein
VVSTRAWGRRAPERTAGRRWPARLVRSRADRDPARRVHAAPTGRSGHDAHEKPDDPQPLPTLEPDEPPRPEVRTFTAVKARTTSVEPHVSQGGFSPDEYAEIDIRTSNFSPHCWHT